jgi:hypothetical protein
LAGGAPEPGACRWLLGFSGWLWGEEKRLAGDTVSRAGLAAVL